MTQRLEEFFNLPPSEELPEEVTPTKTTTELLSEAKTIYSQLTTAEKVDFALPTVVGLEQHDTERDDISLKSLKAFNDLMALGGNVADLHAGKIYEVAGQMLKTALDAKNSKADKKLKLIELQLKKLRAEQVDFDLGMGPGKTSTNNEFDRNELLQHIVSNGKSINTDK